MKTINDIPYGHARPLLRPTKSYEDRALRKNIEDANRNGDCIINVGAGYYRPIPGDPVDEKELNEYLAQEYFESHYGSREEFRRIFGRSWL